MAPIWHIFAIPTVTSSSEWLARRPDFDHQPSRGPFVTDGPALRVAMTSISFTVNAHWVEVATDGDTPLLDVLRNHLGLTGTRFGCGLEQCGSCMVLIDGLPEKSCGKALSTVAGKSVTTIEGLGTPSNPHPLQQAFIELQAGQCGYCLSGILISASALLDRNKAPTRDEIAAALDDNICRCGSHHRILRAVALAAARMREEAPA
jgi:nicotinate dehydrogenase subunit A